MSNGSVISVKKSQTVCRWADSPGKCMRAAERCLLGLRYIEDLQAAAVGVVHGVGRTAGGLG